MELNLSYDKPNVFYISQTQDITKITNLLKNVNYSKLGCDILIYCIIPIKKAKKFIKVMTDFYKIIFKIRMDKNTEYKIYAQFLCKKQVKEFIKCDHIIENQHLDINDFKKVFNHYGNELTNVLVPDENKKIINDNDIFLAPFDIFPNCKVKCTVAGLSSIDNSNNKMKIELRIIFNDLEKLIQ